MESTIRYISASLAPEDVLKDRICDMLLWSDLEYCEAIFETGIAYLGYYIPADPEDQEMLIRTKTFWKWWKNHWRQRDEAFLLKARSVKKIETRRMLYADMHNALMLARAIYPTGVVLEMSYSEMIQNLIDQEIKTL